MFLPTSTLVFEVAPVDGIQQPTSVVAIHQQRSQSCLYASASGIPIVRQTW